MSFSFSYNYPPTTEIYTFPYTTLFRSCNTRAPRSGPSRRGRTISRPSRRRLAAIPGASFPRSEEHTSELQLPDHLVCRLLLEKKNTKKAVLEDQHIKGANTDNDGQTRE